LRTPQAEQADAREDSDQIVLLLDRGFASPQLVRARLLGSDHPVGDAGPLAFERPDLAAEAVEGAARPARRRHSRDDAQLVEHGDLPFEVAGPLQDARHGGISGETIEQRAHPRGSMRELAVDDRQLGAVGLDDQVERVALERAAHRADLD
jgi:hypothetical protein